MNKSNLLRKIRQPINGWKVPSGQSKPAGFTLTEVMIVVAILGILIAIALPGYNRYIKKNDRTQATTVLLKAGHWMEQQFTVNHSYRNEGRTPAIPAWLTTSPESGEKKYTIEVASVNDYDYLLHARPVDKNDDCGTYALDHSGKRTLADTSASTVKIAACWGGSF
ncbi:type IV pilin protein [Glaciimonas sp. GG7]